LSDGRVSKIIDWLCAPDPSSNYQKAKKLRQDGTGLWFLQTEQYLRFKDGTAQFMWLHGIPGSGKSVLSSTILEDLFQSCEAQEGSVTAYFYFDFSDPQMQDPKLMVRSMITQLVQRCSFVSESLDTLFASCEKGQRQISTEVCLQVLKNISRDFPRVYLVLDALDECGSRNELIDILTTMAAWRIKTLHLLVTSRKERDIECSLNSLIDEQNIISLQSQIVDKDIRLYISQRLANDKSLHKWRKDRELQKEIENTLMNGAHGMQVICFSFEIELIYNRFRWAACQLDTLTKCLNRAMLRKQLATLPPTLDKTYERILGSIPEEYSSYAIRLLRWLAFSVRPLLLEELAEAVAIDPERNTPFDRDEVLEDPSDILEICSSLVVLTVISSNEVTADYDLSPRNCEALVLAHYSVQEYLTSERCLQGPMARFGTTPEACHGFIMSSCLSYLQLLDEADYFSINRVDHVKLGLYSANFWINHAQNTTMNRRLTQQVIGIMTNSEAVYYNWIKMHDPDQPQERSDITRDSYSVPGPLYYSCLVGFTNVTQHLIRIKDADVNAQGGHYGTALQAASVGGYDKIVDALLAKGADVNAQGGEYGTALQAASVGGYDKIVNALLAKGADVNAQGGVYGTALLAASEGGHNKVVDILLTYSVDVNTQDRYYGTALQAASEGGHNKIVDSLLAKGADVNAQGGKHNTALQAASVGGHDKIVDVLLAKGADVNAQDRYYGTALQAASVGGHDKIVDVLLAKGADVNGQGGHYGTVLQAAFVGGHDKIIDVLLTHGADVNAQGGHYGTALQAASVVGYDKIVDTLLAKGADVNAQGGEYGTALQAASVGGYDKVVDILLTHGADVNAQGGRYGTALQAASVGGHDKIVDALLAKGTDVNGQGGHSDTALRAASKGGHNKIVDALLAKGADVNAQGREYDTALLVASVGGHDKIVDALLAKGADVNAQGGIYGTALQVASSGGHDKIVDALLAKGADVNAQGIIYGTALQEASVGGHDKIVDALLAKGADVNAQGGKHNTALQAASGKGHNKIVGTLLAKGADVNAEGGCYGSALRAASGGGHDKIVDALLAKGADINAQGRYYGTALQAASGGGYDKTVDALLAKGADVNAQGGYYGTALQAASGGGHDKVVDALLAKDADVNAQGGYYGTALQAASEGGHNKIVDILLAHGAVPRDNHKPRNFISEAIINKSRFIAWSAMR
jgi:ankyrin repeat protein